MATLGAGAGSGYPGVLDTKQTFANATPELPDTNTRMDSEVLNDVLTAIINIETELGVDPAQAAADVATFLSGADTWDAGQQFRLSGDISPAALVADQNDFNPTGLATASTLRIDGGTADRNITGLAGGADGRIIIFHNIGTNDLKLKSEDAGSVAANRFELPTTEVQVSKDDTVMLRYDATSSRWRLGAGAGGGGAAVSFTFFMA